MGYTHYWRMDKPLTIVPVQKALIKEVMDESKGLLANWEGKAGTRAIFSDKKISFNGIEGGSHESFVVDFGKQVGFSFCKTAHKPYDLTVCKILLILAISDGFNFSSDGTDRDPVRLTSYNWPEAVQWFTDKGYAHVLENKVYPYLNKPYEEEAS